MKKTTTSAIILVILCTIFTSVAQIFYKMASKEFALDFSIFTNYFFITGLCMYGIAAVLLIYALKKGELSVIFPMVATGFLWVVLLSYFIFNETLNVAKIAGVISIMIGVSILGGKK